MRSLAAKIWWYFAAWFYGGVCQESPGHEGEVPAGKLFLERRFELRKRSTRSCQFGVMQANDQQDSVFEEHAGVTVNESKSGMLLLLSSAPQKGKLLEVHTDGAGLKPSFSLVEVRWSKPLRKTADGELYLVGCRLSFGPSSYWAL